MELSIISGLVAQFPWLASVAMILGSLVVIGQIVVSLTPSKADDEAWAKIMNIPLLGAVLQALTNFAVIQKK